METEEEEVDPKDYFEDEVRYTISGREVHFIRKPSKMSAYQIARALAWDKVHKRDVFLDFFMKKTEHLIDYILQRGSLQDKRPTKEQKIAFREKLRICKQVVKNNLEDIIYDLITWKSYDEPYDSESYTSFYEPKVGDFDYMRPYEIGGEIKILTYDEKQHDRAIFNLRLQRSLYHLLHSPGFQAVCDDFKLVQDVLQNPDRFPELEQLAKSPMRHFMTVRRIRYIDWEDQLQEGRVVLWKAAKDYEARNFARFSTMARQCLKNKFSNLIDFFVAHKRRIQKFTYPMGSASTDSYLAKLSADISAELWKQGQRAMLSDDIPEDMPYDPFFTFSVCSDYGSNIEERLEWKSVFGGWWRDNEKGIQEVTSENFPHLNEEDVVYIRSYELHDRRKSRAQGEFMEKWNKGEVYQDENGKLHVKDPSPLLREFEDQEKEKMKKPDGSYKLPPKQLLAKNMQKLEFLVEHGAELTLREMLEELYRCSYSFVFGADDKQWSQAMTELKEAVDKEYPGFVEWDSPVFNSFRPQLSREGYYEGDRTIPRHVKEKYVKCFILHDTAHGVEL
jgi:hypothetical protein